MHRANGVVLQARFSAGNAQFDAQQSLLAFGGSGFSPAAQLADLWKWRALHRLFSQWQLHCLSQELEQRELRVAVRQSERELTRQLCTCCISECAIWARGGNLSGRALLAVRWHREQPIAAPFTACLFAQPAGLGEFFSADPAVAQHAGSNAALAFVVAHVGCLPQWVWDPRTAVWTLVRAAFTLLIRCCVVICRRVARSMAIRRFNSASLALRYEVPSLAIGI